jgi:hypothetical protein
MWIIKARIHGGWESCRCRSQALAESFARALRRDYGQHVKNIQVSKLDDLEWSVPLSTRIQ